MKREAMRIARRSEVMRGIEREGKRRAGVSWIYRPEG